MLLIGRDFSTIGEENPRIVFDFGESIRIGVTHYAIRSHGGMRSWKLRGSVDGDTWRLIDRQIDFELFSQDRAVEVFSVSQSNSRYRYLSLVPCGRRSGEMVSLSLAHIEFFGLVEGNHQD
jgi:hypothetical protein